MNLSKREIEKFFEISVNYQPGAANLQEVFKRGNEVAIANDTSFGVAHAPLSKTEKLTLNLTNFINSKKFSLKFPWVGKDIKVMSLRKRENISVTFTIPYIDSYVRNLKEYFEIKEKREKRSKIILKKIMISNRLRSIIIL